MSCRDRNHIAIQGDVLGAAAMGVKNVLCLTGDDVQAGDQPEAKPVFDLDSIQLLRTAQWRDQDWFLSGRGLQARAALVPGCGDQSLRPALRVPASPPPGQKGRTAGANFIQTQFCFDVPAFESSWRKSGTWGCMGGCALLVGVDLLRSEKAAEWIRTHVPGWTFPTRLSGARWRTRPKETHHEGRTHLCVEIIQQVRELPGVAGVHVMAYRQEELVAEIIAEAGLLPRPRQVYTAEAGQPPAPEKVQAHTSSWGLGRLKRRTFCLKRF